MTKGSAVRNTPCSGISCSRSEMIQDDHTENTEIARRSRRNALTVTCLGFFRVLCAISVVSVCTAVAAPPAPAAQTVAEADAKSIGCMSCHTATDRHTMHQNPGVILGCTDCHGGDANIEA